MEYYLYVQHAVKLQVMEGVMLLYRLLHIQEYVSPGATVISDIMLCLFLFFFLLLYWCTT